MITRIQNRLQAHLSQVQNPVQWREVRLLLSRSRNGDVPKASYPFVSVSDNLNCDLYVFDGRKPVRTKFMDADCPSGAIVCLYLSYKGR